MLRKGFYYERKLIILALRTLNFLHEKKKKGGGFHGMCIKYCCKHKLFEEIYNELTLPKA